MDVLILEDGLQAKELSLERTVPVYGIAEVSRKGREREVLRLDWCEHR